MTELFTIKWVFSGSVIAFPRHPFLLKPSVFPDRPGANEFVDREHPAPHLLDRIHTLTASSHAAIALPGSLGTLTELVAAWNLAFVARFSGMAPKPVVTVGSTWMDLVDRLANTLGADRTLVTTVGSVEEAVANVSQRLGASA